MKQITTLGYTLSSDSLTASRTKIEAIKQLPEPTTIKELRQALGLIKYQCKFIPHAAAILAPLTTFLKGKVTNATPTSSNAEAKQAFSEIKQLWPM